MNEAVTVTPYTALGGEAGVQMEPGMDIGRRATQRMSQRGIHDCRRERPQHRFGQTLCPLGTA